MPAQRGKTDWKKSLAAELRPSQAGGGGSPFGEGTELLAKGATTSVGNKGRPRQNPTMDDLLAALEGNRVWWQRARANPKMPLKKKPLHDSLKGLLGGGP